MWHPKQLVREEIPERYWALFGFEGQKAMLGRSSAKESLHIEIQCYHCSEKFWRGVKQVRKRISLLGDNYSPACNSCGRIDWSHDDIPVEWLPYIDWQRTEIRKRGLYVWLSCPKCGGGKYVSAKSLSSKYRKDILCRRCVGHSFEGTATRPTRRRMLLKREILPEFQQYCHFDQQKVIATASGKKLLHILTDCPLCGESRWLSVPHVRSFGRTPFCRQCGLKRRYFADADTIREDWRPFIRFDSQQQRDGNKGPVMIQVECPSCHELRWMQLKSLRKMATDASSDRLPICATCGVESGLKRKPSKTIGLRGYVQVPLSILGAADRALAKAMLSHHTHKKTAITEHRLVMAKHLGRPLLPREQVHHRSSDRADNRLANLRLVTNTSHPQAPKDEVAILSVEIEALARKLQANQINPLGILEQCLDALTHMKDEKVDF